MKREEKTIEFLDYAETLSRTRFWFVLDVILAPFLINFSNFSVIFGAWSEKRAEKISGVALGRP